MRRTAPAKPKLSLVDLPVITGPTLAPRLYGPENYPRALWQAFSVLPNRAELMARRLELRPAPVRFVYIPDPAPGPAGVTPRRRSPKAAARGPAKEK